MGRKVLVTAICVLVTAAITFALVEVLTERTHVPPKLCHIGTFNLQITHKDDQARFGEIAKIIVSNDLQVVALQEVDDTRMKELKQDLRDLDAHNWRYILLPQPVGMRVAVLYDSERVSIACDEPCTLHLHDQDHAGQRDALVVDGRVLPNGFDFTLAVVHLAKHDSEWRKEQLKRLHQWVMEGLESGGEKDIIVAGDFNTPLLLKQDDFESLDGGIGLYAVQQDAGDDMYSSFCDKSYRNPVDFIIISPDCRAEYIDNTSCFAGYGTEAEKDATSDHRLAWASFSRDDLDDPGSTPLDTSDFALELAIPESMQRGRQITIRATTFRNAECTIRVLYPSGYEHKAVPTPISKTINNKKEVVWTWRINGNTNPGVATVQVQATWKWGHALETGTFKITPKPSSADDQDSL